MYICMYVCMYDGIQHEVHTYTHVHSTHAHTDLAALPLHTRQQKARPAPRAHCRPSWLRAPRHQKTNTYTNIPTHTHTQISLLSRYIHGNKERALRLEHTSDLLGFEPPDIKNRGLMLPSPDRVENNNINKPASDPDNHTVAILPQKPINKPQNDHRSRDSESELDRQSMDESRTSNHSVSRNSDSGMRRSAHAADVRDDETRALLLHDGSRQRPDSDSNSHSHDTDRHDPVGVFKRRGFLRWLFGQTDAAASSIDGTATPRRNKDNDGDKGTIVDWQKVFLGERLKIERGWDPEGDGLSDISDSDDDLDEVMVGPDVLGLTDMQPAVTLSMRKKKLVARDETGAVLPLKVV
jgi:hypothetical protein